MGAKPGRPWSVCEEMFNPDAGDGGDLQVEQFGDLYVLDDGIERRTVVHEEHPYITLRIL